MKVLALITALVAVVTAAPKSGLVARDPIDSPEIPKIDDKDFISTVLNAHWYWRHIHCAQDLQWNMSLAESARRDVRLCTHDMKHEISPASSIHCIFFSRLTLVLPVRQQSQRVGPFP